jgi:hypothetical protein
MTKNCNPTKKKKNVEKKNFPQKFGEAFAKYAPVSLLAIAGVVVVASGLLGPPEQAYPDPFDWPVSYEEVAAPAVEDKVIVAERAREPESAPVIAEAPAPEARTETAPVAPRAEPVAPVEQVQEVKPEPEHFKIPAADPPKDTATISTYDATTNKVTVTEVPVICCDVLKPAKTKVVKKAKKKKVEKKKKAKAKELSANDIFLENFTRGMY